MEEQKVGIHKINLIDRNNMLITGVLKVINSNNNSVILKLKDTDLIISGNNLSIESFTDCQINLTGTLDLLKYTKSSKIKESFFKRIFK